MHVSPLRGLTVTPWLNAPTTGKLPNTAVSMLLHPLRRVERRPAWPLPGSSHPAVRRSGAYRLIKCARWPECSWTGQRTEEDVAVLNQAIARSQLKREFSVAEEYL